MSNRVRPREWNGGRLTRPVATWKVKKHSQKSNRSPLAGEMNRITAALSKTLMRSSILKGVVPKTPPTTQRKGDR